MCILLFSISIAQVFAQSDEAGQIDGVSGDGNQNESDETLLPIGGGGGAAAVNTGGRGGWRSLVVGLLALALSAAAIYGLVFFIKKASRRGEVQDPYLKVLASVHLGAGKYAHVVSLGTKAWLLGAGDGGVNLIGEVEDQDILNAMLLDDSKKSAGRGRVLDFKAILGRFGMQVKSGLPGPENIRRHRNRIKGE